MKHERDRYLFKETCKYLKENRFLGNCTTKPITDNLNVSLYLTFSQDRKKGMMSPASDRKKSDFSLHYIYRNKNARKNIAQYFFFPFTWGLFVYTHRKLFSGNNKILHFLLQSTWLINKFNSFYLNRHFKYILLSPSEYKKQSGDKESFPWNKWSFYLFCFIILRFNKI